jgi:carboxypeptidase C (cathepsin A)
MGHRGRPAKDAKDAAPTLDESCPSLRRATMLYLDSPSGVGFSYSDTAADYVITQSS